MASEKIKARGQTLMHTDLPGFPNYGVQGSNRFTGSLALRSTLTPRLVNEAHFGLSGGSTLFSPNISAAMYSGPLADQGGYALNVNNSVSMANAYRSYTPSRRNAPSKVIEDTVSWTKGTHSLSLGATWTEVGMVVMNQTMVPEIRFGVDTTYDPAKVLFDSTNGSKNFPGASSTQITAARNRYAVLTGRVTEIKGNAYLNELTNALKYLRDRVQRGHFIVNPSLQGGANITGNGGFTWYDSMVVELRRRPSKGLLVQANYVWAKAFGSTRLTLRRGRVKDRSDTAPHAFKVNWVYELPVGRGRALFSGMHPVLDRIIGGWDFHGVSRIQSGDLHDFGNVRLVGMTPQELQGAYQLRFDDANKHIYVLPDDIIKNTIVAFNVSATEPTGYSKTYAPPTGRYFAPANSAGCIQVVSGDCAPRHYYVRGTPFVNFDLSLVKKIRFTEQSNFDIRAKFLNAFNNINFDYVTAPNGFTVWDFGEVTSAQSFGRRIQIGLRINF